MRNILFALSAVGLIFISYYLFIRPFEFTVNLNAKTLPGDLVGTIRIWNRSLDSAKVLEVDIEKSLKQSIVHEGRNYIYDWRFTILNDGTTKVNVQISEPERSIRNKILIPFSEQPIEKDARNILNKFYKILEVHLEITSVKVIGEGVVDASFCVCRSLEKNQIEKANGMMIDYPLLSSFVDFHKLTLAGPPNVRIREWDPGLGLLKFDFCFPIQPADSLPSIKDFTYQKYATQHVLKAEYRGNYITSDRAWYELIRYAEQNGYEINGLPIEYFYNNPNMGINESEWKAEIFLPIVKK